MDTTAPVEDIGLALCRSALYEALALGFRPPTRETVARLASAEGALALSDAAAVVAEGLAGHGLALAGPEGASDLEALDASYRRLFGHTARGPVSPYETEYGQDALFQQPQEMGDLAGFLRAFGLALRPEAHERIDHVSCECEFLAFLCRKEAYALNQGDEAMAGEARRAGRLFLRDHFGRFGPTFARRLTREDRGGFYGALGAFCLAFLASECLRLRVPPGSEFLQLRAVDFDDAPMACGTGSELLNIEPPDDDTE
jgi:DMSO reductase family type II enzyme chaperone